MSKWIKKGLPVVHITNLQFIMTVEEFIYEYRNIHDDNEQLIKVKHLMGIRCKFIDTDGEEKFCKHHSKELIPADIASKGILEAFKFVNREGIYKEF